MGLYKITNVCVMKYDFTYKIQRYGIFQISTINFWFINNIVPWRTTKSSCWRMRSNFRTTFSITNWFLFTKIPINWNKLRCSLIPRRSLGIKNDKFGPLKLKGICHPINLSSFAPDTHLWQDLKPNKKLLNKCAS